jgi:hypothetical protein
MSRPPHQAYPPHHPHYGRPLINVHNHDVLCGRGVNISQHPGNERFRALVNTRQDPSYCTTFTTSEKQALAEEIVNHIRDLDPPGRFLKRNGRTQSNRGLAGPWEELSHRECIKKTCQALRDCNRQDRVGYAAQVMAPTDVAESAEERAKSGLSLKQHAAAAVARAHPEPFNYSLNPPLLDRKPAAPEDQLSMRNSESAKRSARDENVSPTVDMAAQWLKKQRTEEPRSFAIASRETAADPVLSTASNLAHSTPAPLVAPVPVSTTPPSAQSHGHPCNPHMAHQHYDPGYHMVVSHHIDSPHLPSPTSFHHHESMAPAPYSPVVLLNDHDHVDRGMGRSTDIDPHVDLDPYPSAHDHHSNDQFHEPHPFNSTHHEDPDQNTDDFKAAAAAAASSLGHHPHHHRDNSLTLMNGEDDAAHDSLHISDL